MHTWFLCLISSFKVATTSTHLFATEITGRNDAKHVLTQKRRKRLQDGIMKQRGPGIIRTYILMSSLIIRSVPKKRNNGKNHVVIPANYFLKLLISMVCWLGIEGMNCNHIPFTLTWSVPCRVYSRKDQVPMNMTSPVSLNCQLYKMRGKIIIIGSIAYPFVKPMGQFVNANDITGMVWHINVNSLDMTELL